MTSLMVTGHRAITHPATVALALRSILEAVPAEVAISGGAEGADTLFAVAALDVDVPLHLYLPNRYYRDWYPRSVPDAVVRAAHRVVYVVDRPECPDWRRRWTAERWWLDNHTRNDVMVRAADEAVVVSRPHPRDLLGHGKGGTAHCVRALRGAGFGRVWWVNDSTPDASTARTAELVALGYDQQQIPFAG